MASGLAAATANFVVAQPGLAVRPEEASAALQRGGGFLRAEVASAISRRYTPELTFEVM